MGERGLVGLGSVVGRRVVGDRGRGEGHLLPLRSLTASAVLLSHPRVLAGLSIPLRRCRQRLGQPKESRAGRRTG